MSRHFSLNCHDAALVALVRATDRRTLATWARDCAERALPLFEGRYPADQRPRQALATLEDWIATGVFRMAVIRGAALAAHAAAREVGEDNPARSAARATGQAVAAAHVGAHALAAAAYALQAIHRAAGGAGAAAAVASEREWQYQRLLALRSARAAPDPAEGERRPHPPGDAAKENPGDHSVS